MKKYFFLVVLLIQYNLYAQQTGNGKVKIYLRTISCDEQATDNIFDVDGKGNEVFVTIFYSVASSNGTTRYTNKITTAVYGDITGRQGRNKAGTASTNGGIKARDVIYANPNTEAWMPIGDERFKGQLMFDVELGPTDIISIVPVLWEWDSDTKTTQNSFESFLFNSFNAINVHTAPIAQKFHKVNSPFIYGDATSCIDLAGMTRILQGVNGIDGNRPLGMKPDGTYSPKMFVLNQNILNNWQSVYQALNNQECTFYYNERDLGNTRDHGNYYMTINVDYTPPIAISGSTKNISGIKKDFPSKNINISNTNLAIAGNWIGTQTNDYGLYPQNIAFELTANGEYLIKDMNGAVAARGSYIFSNNLLSGSYKQLSSGEIFSFAATFDPATQKISGTLGSGNAVTGQGKWSVIKK
jgi:hypothetical protein